MAELRALMADARSRRKKDPGRWTKKGDSEAKRRGEGEEGQMDSELDDCVGEREETAERAAGQHSTKLKTSRTTSHITRIR